MTNTQTIIVGAVPAGLASATCLQKAGVGFTHLEKYPQLATNW